MAQLLVRLRLLFVLAVVLVAGTACSGGDAAPTSSHTSRFPVKVGTVTIPRRPSRIVSLSATATQDLYAVGAGKQVVAVDSYSTFPPRAPRTKLSGYTPNVEAIAKYRPDLVVVSDDTEHIVAQLGKLHIPVLVEAPAANLSSAYEEIGEIAKATGHENRARRVVARIRHRVKAIVASVPRPGKQLTIYHELDQTHYSATSHTFVGQMYSLLGLHNIADRAGGSSDYPQLSAEYIIASNPDLIVLADTICCHQDAAKVAARPGWSNIAAVKSGQVVPVNDSIASEWGPRIVLFLKKVAAAVKQLEARSR